MAGRIGFEEWETEKNKWVKISSGQVFTDWFFEPTQVQIDLVFDWCVANKKQLPHWLLPDEEDWK